MSLLLAVGMPEKGLNCGHIETQCEFFQSTSWSMIVGPGGAGLPARHQHVKEQALRWQELTIVVLLLRQTRWRVTIPRHGSLEWCRWDSSSSSYVSIFMNLYITQFSD